MVLSLTFAGMFTGIVEALATVISVQRNESNLSFWLSSSISNQFKVDQSVAHNGVCLTVEEINEDLYRVTAIDETLKKTNLGRWHEGTLVNLERSLTLSNRLDGHLVQGHVDATAVCVRKKDAEGSTEYRFEFPKQFAALVIEKGSIAVNGISLTIFDVSKSKFSVAIIPYTLAHTNMQQVQPESIVNIEFDMIGKYVNRIAALQK